MVVKRWTKRERGGKELKERVKGGIMIVITEIFIGMLIQFMFGVLFCLRIALG